MVQICPRIFGGAIRSSPTFLCVCVCVCVWFFYSSKTEQKKNCLCHDATSDLFQRRAVGSEMVHWVPFLKAHPHPFLPHPGVYLHVNIGVTESLIFSCTVKSAERKHQKLLTLLSQPCFSQKTKSNPQKDVHEKQMFTLSIKSLKPMVHTLLLMFVCKIADFFVWQKSVHVMPVVVYFIRENDFHVRRSNRLIHKTERLETLQ